MDTEGDCSLQTLCDMAPAYLPSSPVFRLSPHSLLQPDGENLQLPGEITLFHDPVPSGFTHQVHCLRLASVYLILQASAECPLHHGLCAFLCVPLTFLQSP